MSRASYSAAEGGRLHAVPDPGSPFPPDSGHGSAGALVDGGLAGLTALASHACGTPLAFLTVTDAGAQRPLTAHGADLRELPRHPAICQLGAPANGGIIVAGGHEGARDLLVDGDSAAFQAAAPVRADDGTLMGMLCVADRAPRALAPEAADALLALGRQAAFELGLQARLADLERAEAPLRERAFQQAAAADLGQRALRGLDLHQLMDEATQVVAERLDLSFCQLWELMPDGERFVLRAAVGWPDEAIGSLTIRVDARSQPGFNLMTGGSVFIDDVAQEKRFRPPDFVTEQGATSGFSVSIPGPAQAFGVIGGHVREHRTFTEDDASFLQSVANVLGAAIERRRGEEDVHHRATHDPLTGLANRSLLLDQLDTALRARGEVGPRPAVLFLDVDRFKLINDSLGHDVGDEILVALAGRLDEALRPGDTLARFGGDEFVVLLEHVPSARSARAVAKRIAAALARPLQIAGDEHVVTVSIGVAVAARRHSEPQTLLQEADSAMYRAKRSARGGHELFDDSMLAAATSELRIERALRSALERSELELFYQPLVSLADGQIVGLEALLRWVNPDLGPVEPSEFIPVAEDSGLIVPVGEWVLNEACRQMAEWTAALGTRLPIPVTANVSGRQLAERDFPDIVGSALRKSGLAPGQLGLELTESVLLEGGKAPLTTLNALKDLGVQLILDDFGTGYSSLAYLRRFPLDTIKIDRSFVAGLGSAGHDSAIVDAVVAMTHALGLVVVAEGIEDERQLRHLRDRGAEVGQGFLFARPMAADAMWPLLSKPARDGSGTRPA